MITALITGFGLFSQRVREALAIAVAMGANTVRLTSCGVSVGGANSIEPTLGNYGNWDTHDYVIWAAGQYGLRVILPLTDNYSFWKYSHLCMFPSSTRMLTALLCYRPRRQVYFPELARRFDGQQRRCVLHRRQRHRRLQSLHLGTPQSH